MKATELYSRVVLVLTYESVDEILKCDPEAGGRVLPYKGSMGTCGQPRYVFRDFCLKQGIFSWTINSLRVCSTNLKLQQIFFFFGFGLNVLNRVSKVGILS